MRIIFYYYNIIYFLFIKIESENVIHQRTELPTEGSVCVCLDKTLQAVHLQSQSDLPGRNVVLYLTVPLTIPQSPLTVTTVDTTLTLTPHQTDEEILWSRQLSWPVQGPNAGSLPRFQVETSRVLVLTTTATSEDVLLIIDMEYEHKKDRRLKEEEETIQHGEIIEIAEETLEEINANLPLECVVDNIQDPLLSHSEEPRPEVINCDIENNREHNNNNEHHDETVEEVNFSLKLPPTATGQIGDSVMEEIDEYCDISDESDDVYEYYYEEITDDDDDDDKD